MKKLLCLFLALCLVLPLAACGNDDPQVTTTTAPTSTGEIALKDLPLRVGVIYPGKISEADTGSYTIHKELLLAMRREGLDETQDVVVQELVPELADDVVKAVDRLVEDGALIIFGTALGYNEGLAEAADKYPDVVFCCLGGTNGNDYNFVTYFAPLYQVYYMMGAAAAMKAQVLETQEIGFISTAGKETPEAAAIINAFARGVQVYLPSATVYLRVLEPGATEAMEWEAVNDLHDVNGCQVFGAYTHTAGTLQGAYDLGLYATGPWFELDSSNPQNKQLKSHLLASPQLKWYSFFRQAIQALGKCSWANEFATALGTTHYYGTFPSASNTNSNTCLTFQRGLIDSIEAAYSVEALNPNRKGQIQYIYPDQEDPNATLVTILEATPIQGPFAGFYYDVQIEGHNILINGIPAVMVDTDGNIRVPAGEPALEETEIREMDYYVVGIELA